MIIDSSAVMSILLAESDSKIYADAIADAKHRVMAAPTYLELCMVFCGRRQDESIEFVEQFVQRAGISIRPFGQQAAAIAARAFLIYGKGRGHPAQLNFGDCISYAMSKVEAMPLLFKGNDFIHTDVEKAL
jgi:ribonuclease VapC